MKVIQGVDINFLPQKLHVHSYRGIQVSYYFNIQLIVFHSQILHFFRIIRSWRGRTPDAC